MNLITLNNNKNLIINKERNIGIEILRMILCFRIVLLHYYASNNKYILSLINNRYQVSCFFFISFYFLYPTIKDLKSEKIKTRLDRLLIPYINYPIMIWIINNLLFLILKNNRFNRFLSLTELKTNLIVGRGIYGIGILWFHFNLLIFTLLFYISRSFLKNTFLSVFQFTALLSYILQYSGKNYNFFNKYKSTISMSVGNLIETLPLAIGAFSISSFNFFQFISNNMKKYKIFSFYFLYLIFKYNVFSYLDGNSSPGIKKFCISFILFTNFYIFHFKKIHSNILVIIRHLTKYTQGIYCLHFLIMHYFKKIFDKNGTFIGCISLYIISYLISFFGFKAFKNSKLKYLFC